MIELHKLDLDEVKPSLLSTFGKHPDLKWGDEVLVWLQFDREKRWMAGHITTTGSVQYLTVVHVFEATKYVIDYPLQPDGLPDIEDDFPVWLELFQIVRTEDRKHGESTDVE